jgi:small GTP-binding protein
MVQKKICMLGAFAVGKTSLVTRFVDSSFSEKYHTTMGVRIEKKALQLGGKEWHLIIWDLAGEDEFLQIRSSYLRGSSGYLLVADGTRRATLEAAVKMQQRVRDTIGDVPFVFMLNKSDLADEWEIAERSIEALSKRGWTWLKASAKTGAGVEEAFLTLVGKMMEG